jgi:hypothetical protein
MNLPAEEESHKIVYLPDNQQVITPNKTLLPFPKSTKKMREADILLGLKRMLVSVKKLAEEGHTTVFHPEDKGVTVHKKEHLPLTHQKSQCSKGVNKRERN